MVVVVEIEIRWGRWWGRHMTDVQLHVVVVTVVVIVVVAVVVVVMEAHDFDIDP